MQSIKRALALSVPMLINLSIPVMIAGFTSVFAGTIAEVPVSAAAFQLPGMVAGSLTDTLILQKGELRWFETPPNWQETRRQLLDVFIQGLVIAVGPGFAVGYPAFFGPFGLRQALGSSRLAGIVLLTSLLFVAVYPVLYLFLLRLALSFPFLRGFARDSSLVFRNVIMTALLMPWNFLVVAQFLR